MVWSRKKQLLVGLGLVIMLGLAGPAWGQDSDGDGVPDVDDLCPDSDPNFPVDINGCPDTDDDGVADVNDLCPGTPPLTQVNVDGCIDTDGDGITDGDDVCPGISDPCQYDGDGDGVGDECDLCPTTDPSHGVGPDGCKLATVLEYEHRAYPVVTSVRSIAVDADDNVLIARKAKMHDGQLQVPVQKNDGDFGTALSDFWTPAPTDDVDDICQPWGLDVDPAGNIVVGMVGGTICTLSTISATGAPVSEHDVTGVGNWPSDIRNIRNGACDGDGNFWWLGVYADPCHPDGTVRHSSLLDNSDGSEIMRIENDDHPPIEYTGTDGSLHSVAVDGDGLVYVGDVSGIWRFDPCDIAGTAVNIAGGAGSGRGEIGGPFKTVAGLAVKHGKIYAVDNGYNSRIVIYDRSTGEFIQELAIDPNESQGDMDVDSAGSIYLNSPTDAAYSEISTPDIHKWSVDSDGDGVGDPDDLCPGTSPGTQVAADGCPDADGDGVSDGDDLCPGTPGGTEVATDGCPDSDGDGVSDVDDLCAPAPWDANDIAVGPDGCPMEQLYSYYTAGTGRGIHNPCIDVDSEGGAWVAYEHPKLVNPAAVDRFELKGSTIKKTDTVNIDITPNPDGYYVYALGVDSQDNLLHYTKDTTGVGNPPTLTVFSPLAETILHQYFISDPVHTVSLVSDQDDNIWMGESALLLVAPENGSKVMEVDDDDLAPGKVLGANGSRGIDIDENGWVYAANGPLSVIRLDPCDIGNTAERIWQGNSTVDPCTGDPRFGDLYFSDGIRGMAVLGDRLYLTDQGNTGMGIPSRVRIYQVSTGKWIQDLEHAVSVLDEIAVNSEGVIYATGGSTFDLHAWAPPICGDALHQPPAGDVDDDCVVNRRDVIDMAELWLLCTDPDGEGCQNLIQAELMYMPYCGEATMTVDGLLSDWPADPCWVDLNLVYTGEPCDMTSAKYTACWDPCDDLFYALINVVDTDHVFESAPLDWHTSDRVEIYVQADPNGGGSWGSADSGQYDKAQQYIVGYQNIIPGWTWAVFGHGTYIPDDIEPGDAEFTDAGRVSGDTITYEISAKAWQWYGGRTVPIDSVPSVHRDLEPGLQVGFDIVADSRRGTLPHDDGEFGMLSANPYTDKYQRAEQFQRWALLDYDGSIVPPGCGDWGYYAADVSGDCYVNLSDVLLMYSTWLDCTDPSCAFAQ